LIIKSATGAGADAISLFGDFGGSGGGGSCTPPLHANKEEMKYEKVFFCL